MLLATQVVDGSGANASESVMPVQLSCANEIHEMALLSGILL